MTETWRPIPGWDGYEASDLGRVRSVPRVVIRTDGKQYSVRGRILTAHEGPLGYMQVVLYRTGEFKRSMHVHRLVLAAFEGNRAGMVACHSDGTKTNNALSNLRWGTYTDNAHDAVAHGTHHCAAKTHCKHGHEFTPENTYVNRRGARECETCRTARRAAYEARKAAA